MLEEKEIKEIDKIGHEGRSICHLLGVVSGPQATVLGKKHVELFLFCTIARELFYECSPYSRLLAIDACLFTKIDFLLSRMSTKIDFCGATDHDPGGW
jgi:hypothetical protein